MYTEFAKKFGADSAAKAITAKAPGRVNLIGEHTDYNEGFVFPIAINFTVNVMGALRDDNIIHAYSLDLHDEVEFDLAQNAKDTVHTWSNYLRGVIWALQEQGHRFRGMNIMITGDVPQGAGLSSSAAFEVASAMLMEELYSLSIPPLDMIRLCQRVENAFVGLNCGIMDQFISRLGQAGQALLLDCRDLSYSYHPVSMDLAKVVVINTGVKHTLVASEYNQRRKECERGVEVFKSHDPNIRSLRDVSLMVLDKYATELEPVVARRCRHVVEENQRTLDAAQALTKNDMAAFGKLMYASHYSLRDLYEVSCRELDILVDLAHSLPGVYGSRMTGGGFGGCTVNLVKPENVKAFVEGISKGYEKETGRTPEVYICEAGAGARIVKNEK